MLLAFFIGTILGGAIAGLSFEMNGFGIGGLVMCMLSMMLSMMTGMFFFMMIPMITPLDANLLHVILCLAGGAMFSFGLGAVSNMKLKKNNIV